jgi:hypothetical protein
MENTIILIPSAGELTLHFGHGPEVVSRLPKRRSFAQNISDLGEVDRSAYVVGINRQTERIYGAANVAAVVIMVAALVAAFGVYLGSFIA